MNNFCTKCGAELNGKAKCEKCGNVNGGALQNIADKVKNYDYKSKADELKAKANEAVDKAKAYDYKGKAEEIKEAAKNYDYKEKAKEISESVKNYDYKAETENIKKGGIKYFWNKHRKLSIAIICVLVIGCVSGIFGDEESTNNTAGTTSSTDSESSTKYKTNLSDDEIIDIAMMTFDANYFSSSTPEFINAKIIGQDKYGRCAAILEYDLGGVKGRRKYYVFADGMTKDEKVFVRKGIVEESMNNSIMSESTIKIKKEQFGWNTPRQ